MDDDGRKQTSLASLHFGPGGAFGRADVSLGEPVCAGRSRRYVKLYRMNLFEWEIMVWFGADGGLVVGIVDSSTGSDHLSSFDV